MTADTSMQASQEVDQVLVVNRGLMRSAYFLLLPHSCTTINKHYAGTIFFSLTAARDQL
jgi:hypothetical protein